MRRFHRSRRTILSLACLIGLAAAGALPAPVSLAQSTVDPTGYLVTINSGTCPSPDATAAYEVGTTLPWGLSETADDQVIEGAALAVEEVVNVSLDNLIQEGQPFTVAVASPDSGAAIVACGDIVNLVEQGRIVLKLAPVGDAGVAGVAILDRDEQGFLGLGGEEVQVTAYVLTGLGAAAAGPAATTAPAMAEAPTATAAAATGDAATAPAGLAVTIDAEDIYFRPNVITLPADTPVEVTFTNQGQATHNFSLTDHNNPGLENLNIDVTVNPGETKTFTVNAPAGDYYFFCNQPGHEQAGMRGYLQIKDGAEITTAEATVTPPAG